MKFLFLTCSLLMLAASRQVCKKKAAVVSGCYKGRLEIKGACMNYTIRMLQENYDTSLLTARWTNESTGKTYNNVFALASRCTFPSSLKEGDEFYFTIDSTTVQDCAVCMIYYPVPPKKLSIKVFTQPCNP